MFDCIFCGCPHDACCRLGKYIYSKSFRANSTQPPPRQTQIIPRWGLSVMLLPTYVQSKPSPYSKYRRLGRSIKLSYQSNGAHEGVSVLAMGSWGLLTVFFGILSYVRRSYGYRGRVIKVCANTKMGVNGGSPGGGGGMLKLGTDRGGWTT